MVGYFLGLEFYLDLFEANKREDYAGRMLTMSSQFKNCLVKIRPNTNNTYLLGDDHHVKKCFGSY